VNSVAATQTKKRAPNRRNGRSKKTVHADVGDLTIATPRDRDGTFEPQLIGKHQRRVPGFDEKILALYAKGMTTRASASSSTATEACTPSPWRLTRRSWEAWSHVRARKLSPGNCLEQAGKRCLLIQANHCHCWAYMLLAALF
jgi:hypothetical protein